MFDKDFVKKLKQVNVSVDTEKASESLKQSYGALSRADKERLIALTGQNRHSLYRAERTGMITAKLLLPAAYVCNVSPTWLTGESDVQEEFSDALMIRFLQQHGYDKLIKELEEKKGEKKRRRSRKSATQEVAEDVVAVAAAEDIPVVDLQEEEKDEECDENIYCVSLQLQTNAAHQVVLEKLEVEQAVYLLRSLAIRAAYNEDDAQIYDVIKRCLLT